MARKNEIFVKDGEGTIALKQLAERSSQGYVKLFYRYKRLSEGNVTAPTAIEVLASPKQGRPPMDE